MFLALNIGPALQVLFLVFLEGILSVDNALVLSLMVRGLPPTQRPRALVYGIWGAFLFRALALLCLSWLIQAYWIRIVGGFYLIWIGLASLFGTRPSLNRLGRFDPFAFWRTVVAIEVVDMAFSADSILASLSVSDSYWILVTGGVLGIAMMRVAAGAFIWLVERFPGMERTAYLIVTVCGARLACQGAFEGMPSWPFTLLYAAAIFSGLTHSPKLHGAKSHG